MDSSLTSVTYQSMMGVKLDTDTVDGKQSD